MKKYYEVNMSKRTKLSKKKDESMLLIAEREPSVREAERFLAADIVNTYKCDHIVDIIEVSREYAESNYDLDNEKNIPVFK